MSTVRGDGIAYHGVAHQGKAAVRRVNRRLKAGLYCRELLAQGIFGAAGAAAGRKHCLEVGQPISALMGTGKDHEDIDGIAKRLEDMGRDRYAFQRLVWRQAQLAVDDAEIWSAIGARAEALTDLWADDGGDNVTTIRGATARAIMRRAGVRPTRSRFLDRPSADTADKTRHHAVLIRIWRSEDQKHKTRR